MSRRTLTEMNNCLEKFYDPADIQTLETPSHVRILFQTNANVAIRDGWGWQVYYFAAKNSILRQFVEALMDDG